MVYSSNKLYKLVVGDSRATSGDKQLIGGEFRSMYNWMGCNIIESKKEEEEMSKEKCSAIVFCDFDGTITAVETFVGVLKQFSPVLANELIPKILAKEITLRQGVRQIVEAIPSSVYPHELLSFVQDKPIRPGLSSLIDYLDSRQIPFVVISGGLRCLVEAVLKRENLYDRCAKIYAVDIDQTGERLKVISEWKSGSELVAKVDIIKRECRNREKVIMIGDSITDLNASKFADLVFARDGLCDYLKEENVEFIEWKDFEDIKTKLQSIEDRFLF